MVRAPSPWILVLDDDPTGTQGVAGVPVVIQPSAAAFRWAAQQGNCAYALTNTRAMTPGHARDTVITFVEAAQGVANQLGRDLTVINRSDSTLRGHFPLEIEQLQTTARPDLYRGCLLVPAFPDAGRVTIDGIHSVRRNGRLVPVAETEFATDSTFGYTDSRLTDWASARVPRTWRVVHLPSRTIDRGRDAVVEFLDNQVRFTVVCPSVRDDADLAVLASAQRHLEEVGVHYLVQAGPAYPRHLAGITATDTVAVSGDSPGVVVVGSHTQLTTSQLAHAQARFDLSTVDIDVARLLSEAAADEVNRCVAEARIALQSHSVILATTRLRQADPDEALSLQIANQVARGVAEITRQILLVRPGFVISKGGITSRDVAAVSLGWDSALVEGPLVDQTLPVWSAPGAPDGDTRLIIFPGNVGEEDLLSRALEHLSVRQRDHHLGASA